MPRPRASATRVVYVGRPHGRRFRNLYVVDGERVVDSFETEALAKAAATRFSREHADEESPTVSAAIDTYLKTQKAENWREGSGTAYITERRLRIFLDPLASRPISTITDDDLKRRRKALVEAETGFKYARKSINECMKASKCFFAWAVKEKYRRTNPAETLALLKNENAGKPKLTLAQVRQLRAVTKPAAFAGDESALVVEMLIIFGPRALEVQLLKPTDVDGHILRFTDAKRRTEHPVRIPDDMIGLLTAFAEKRRGADRLFSTKYRGYPRDCVKKWCQLAGVPAVTAQGLRGTHDSIGVELGMVPEVVAQATNHTVGVMKKHYLTPGAERTGKVVRLLDALGSNPVPAADAGNAKPPIRYQGENPESSSTV
jgi:integrase